MGEIVGINIIKGVGALFLVFVICFMANIFLSVATKSTTPNMAIVFAWIGTTPAMLYSGASFWRRFAASLLGSITSLIVPATFSILNGALMSAGLFAYLPVAIFGIVGYLAILNIGQLVVAYLVARAVVKRGLGRPKTSPLVAV